MDRIQEVFVPSSVTTPEELVAFIAKLVSDRGGNPASVRFVDTNAAIPNVKHSDEWPCLTVQFDFTDGQSGEGK